jgi:heme-degrading monooxygenase HmoA
VWLRPAEAMYVSLSHLRIAPARAPELIEAFRGRCGLVEGHDGFIDLQVWQSDGDPGEIVMVSRWRDRACFKAYMKSQDHQTSHERITEPLQSAISLESLQHMHTFEVVAE